MNQYFEVINLNKKSLSEITNMLTFHNIGYLSYGIEKNKKKINAFFTHQEWAKNYYSNNLFDVDPLVKAAKILTNSVIPWDMVPINNNNQKQIMIDRFACCNLESGFTFSKISDSFFEITAIGFIRKNEQKIDEIRTLVTQILKPVTYMVST